MFNKADSRKVDTPFAAGIDPCQQSPSNVIYPYRQEKKPSFQGNDNETFLVREKNLDFFY